MPNIVNSPKGSDQVLRFFVFLMPIVNGPRFPLTSTIMFGDDRGYFPETLFLVDDGCIDGINLAYDRALRLASTYIIEHRLQPYHMP